jgi:hypothetical protein
MTRRFAAQRNFGQHYAIIFWGLDAQPIISQQTSASSVSPTERQEQINRSNKTDSFQQIVDLPETEKANLDSLLNRISTATESPRKRRSKTRCFVRYRRPH